MAAYLQSSGTISLLDLRCFFCSSAPDSINEHSPSVGITAGSTASLCNFYGLSKPTVLGESYGGGYYVGNYGGYYLITSPKSGQQCNFMWGLSCYLVSTGTDGYYNTCTVLNDPIYCSAYYSANATINGYTDWYLPSADESSVIASNRCTPPVEERFSCVAYWTSNAHSTCRNCAYAYCFSSGYALFLTARTSSTSRVTRPVRRQLI